MNRIELERMIRAKELALYDCGSITLVRPTGRYLDTYEHGAADHVEPRHKWIVEVKGGLFGSKWWVYALNLKNIHSEAKE